MIAGGKTARPLPLTIAPRPIPLFSVVRMRKNANASSAPARGQDSPGSGPQRRYLLRLVTPVAARLLVQVLRERLRQPVGEGFDHDRPVVVVLGLVPSGQLVGAVDRDRERPEVIVALSHIVRQRPIRTRVAVVGLLAQE